MSENLVREQTCYCYGYANRFTVVFLGSAVERHVFYMAPLIGAVSGAALLLLLLLVVLYKWKQVCLQMVYFLFTL